MKVLDSVYMIVLPKRAGIVYTAPAPSAKEAWENCEKQSGITGWTREYLFGQGYRAMKVTVGLRAGGVR